MELNPAQFKLLLAGPKVSRLMPFVTQRGYHADGCSNGADTLEVLRQSPVHVLLAELDLDDMLLADLVQVVRRENLAGAVILLDDPAKSGLVVSQLIRGVDGYVATPPNEEYLFRIIERQLLAQWAVAQMARGEQDKAQKQRLEKALHAERSKVTELVKEIASLRDQLSKAKNARGSPMDVPDTQLGRAKGPGVGRAPASADGGFDDVANTKPSADDRLLADELLGELDDDREGATVADDDADLFLDLEDSTLRDRQMTQTPQTLRKPIARKPP